MSSLVVVGIIITMVLPQAVIAYDSRHIVRRARETPTETDAWRAMHLSLCVCMVCGTALALATITPIGMVAAGTALSALITIVQFQMTAMYLNRQRLG